MIEPIIFFLYPIVSTTTPSSTTTLISSLHCSFINNDLFGLYCVEVNQIKNNRQEEERQQHQP